MYWKLLSRNLLSLLTGKVISNIELTFLQLCIRSLSNTYEIRVRQTGQAVTGVELTGQTCIYFIEYILQVEGCLESRGKRQNGKCVFGSEMNAIWFRERRCRSWRSDGRRDLTERRRRCVDTFWSGCHWGEESSFGQSVWAAYRHRLASSSRAVVCVLPRWALLSIFKTPHSLSVY